MCSIYDEAEGMCVSKEGRCGAVLGLCAGSCCEGDGPEVHTRPFSVAFHRIAVAPSSAASSCTRRPPIRARIACHETQGRAISRRPCAPRTPDTAWDADGRAASMAHTRAAAVPNERCGLRTGCAEEHACPWLEVLHEDELRAPCPHATMSVG